MEVSASETCQTEEISQKHDNNAKIQAATSYVACVGLVNL